MHIEAAQEIFGPGFRVTVTGTGGFRADLSPVIGNNRADKSVPSLSKIEQMRWQLDAHQRLVNAGVPANSIFVFATSKNKNGEVFEWPSIVVQGTTMTQPLSDIRARMAALSTNGGMEARQLEDATEAADVANGDIPF